MRGAKRRKLSNVKSSKESRKIRSEVSVGCGNMEATGDLTGGQFLWKEGALCSKSNRVPPLGPAHFHRQRAARVGCVN